MRVIGEFERAALLAILHVGDEAYGVSIRHEVQQALKRSVSLGAVYTTLDRLIEKGFVSTFSGDPTPQRGGRAKKFFKVTPRGMKALHHARRASDALWALHPVKGTR